VIDDGWRVRPATWYGQIIAVFRPCRICQLGELDKINRFYLREEEPAWGARVGESGSLAVGANGQSYPLSGGMQAVRAVLRALVLCRLDEGRSVFEVAANVRLTAKPVREIRLTVRERGSGASPITTSSCGRKNMVRG
jgi:hypothetical protein